MKQVDLEICDNRLIAPGVYKMFLKGDVSAITRPGQFVNIKLDGFFLRRPISVCDFDNGSLTIIYKVVGKGTEAMSKLKDCTLDVLAGLGNGYDVEKSGKKPLLIGGGAGIPPLYKLAKTLLETGKNVTVILGFNTSSEIFLKREFERLGCKVILTTVDGTSGLKGFATAAMDGLDYSYIYACGPEPMLKAVYKTSKTSGQFSFEERMGCGFGACMGCSCKTLYGNKRICRDGPVLEKEEIIWED